MNDDRWIVIPNWGKFQHYKTRQVPWIKLYTELNSRDDWRQLSFAQRGLLVSIWLEYARSNGRLRSRDLWGRVGQRDRHGNIEALIQAGLVELSSRPSRARERGTSYPKEAGAANTANGAAPAEEKTASAGLPSAEEVARVRGLVAEVFEK